LKTIYLIYSGDFNSISGGCIYNRKLKENLKYWEYKVEAIQLTERQTNAESRGEKNFYLQMAEIPCGSILLIDSLVFGCNPILWEKYSHSHVLIALMHLPLFLNPVYRDNPLIKENEMRSLEYATHVVVTSVYTRYILEEEGILPEKITVIYPGVEICSRKKIYPAVPKQLLCVSGISFYKNQMLLLKALSRLRKYNWTLMLVGSTFSDLEYFLDILKYISANGLNHRVVITGEVTGEELMKVYSQSDLFLFPSMVETYGMVVSEALNCGIPVFALESDGIRENFGRHPVCFFRDEDSLYFLLLRVFEEQGFYSGITQEMVQQPACFPGWEMVAKLFAGLFKKIENHSLVKSFHE
jgi:glycosyltransferase involved in cell wall biosynthesis